MSSVTDAPTKLKKNYLTALREAIDEELGSNPDFFCLGEDIGLLGGAFGVTDGLQAKYGVNRVIDMPISEAAIVGVAVGAAMNGKTVMAEMQFIDFISCGFDQIVNFMATYSYRTAGEVNIPVVVRGPAGGYGGGALYHSQMNEAWFAHSPGLKVVCPSTPYDAKGLLKASLRDGNPVIFYEIKELYRQNKIEEELPDEDYIVPLGKARIAREGSDVTFVTYGNNVYHCLEAADVLAAEAQPMTVEFEQFLSAPVALELRHELPPNFAGGSSRNTLEMGGGVFIGSRDHRLGHPGADKLFDDDGNALHPLLIVDAIEVEGPIVTDEERGKQAAFWPADLASEAEVRACLTRFAERAWRRPVAADEIDRYTAVYTPESGAGEKSRAAYLSAMAGVLASKSFCYLENGDTGSQRRELNDFELASRLSYFLWGSLPDEPLLEAARTGSLKRPEILQSQVARMIADSKIARFLETFPHQWLELHRVGEGAHLLRQLGHDLAALAGQEVVRLLDQFEVVGGGNQIGAGRRAALDLVQHARPRAGLEHAVGA